MYTLFEQIILHRCVFVFCRHAFASASRAFVHRNVLARDAPARLLFLHLLRWSPFNISLEWLCEYFI